MHRTAWLAAALAAIACDPPTSTAGAGGDAPAVPTSAGVTPPTAASARVAPQPDPQTLALLDVAGEKAAFVFLVRPDRWPDLHASLTRLTSALPPEARAFMATLGTFDSVLKLTLQFLPTTKELDLTALDRSRPIVLALAESTLDGPAGVVAEAIFGGVPPLQHRLVLPAKDPVALADALAAALGPPAKARPTPSIPKGRVWRYSDEEKRLDPQRRRDLEAAGLGPMKLRWLAVVPGDGHVVVHAGAFGGGHAEPSVRPPVPPARTPALVAAATGRTPAAVLVRSWRLRSFWALMGASQAIEALRHVSPEHRSALLGAATRLVLTSELMMDDESAQFDDHLVALAPDPGGVRLSLVSSLTPKSAEALAAGQAGAARTLPLRTKAARFEATTALDLQALLGKVSAPASLARLRTPGQIARAFQECGAGCWLHLLLRRPLGAAVAYRNLAGRGGVSLASLPRATQVAVLDLGPGGASPRMALAAVFPKDRDPTALRDALAANVGAEVKLEVATRGEDRVLLAGVGVAPGEVFDLGGAGEEAPAIHTTRLDLSLVADVVRKAGPAELADALGKLGTLRWTTRRSGRALLHEVTLTVKGSPTPPETTATFDGVDWPSPRRATPPSPGDLCLQGAGWALVQGLEALSHAPPDQRAQLLGRALGGARLHLACATTQASTRAAAQALRRMVVLPAAEKLERAWHVESALLLLEDQCSPTAPIVCQRLEALKARPKLQLVRAAIDCERSSIGAAHLRVVVTADGKRAIDGTPWATADLPQLAARARGTVMPEEEDEPYRLTVELAVDARAPFSALGPVFDDLDPYTRRYVWVMRRPEGGVGWAPMSPRPGRAAPSSKRGRGSMLKILQPLRTDDPVLRVDGEKLAIQRVGRGAPPKPSDLEALETELAEWPDVPRYLYVSPTTRAGQLLPVVGAFCSNAVLVDDKALRSAANAPPDDEQR